MSVIRVFQRLFLDKYYFLSGKNAKIFGLVTHSLFRARVPKHADVALAVSHGNDSFLGVDVNCGDIGILRLL